MKNRVCVIIILSIAVVCSLVLGLSACESKNNTPTHTHNYQWVDNGDGTHKQHCSVSGCDVPDINSGSHNFTNGNCVCGKTKPAEDHMHAWSQVWETSATHHWHNCTVSGCTITDNTQKDGYSEHDFTNGNCICGKSKPSDSHSHVWSQVWETSATHHWHNCTASGCTITDNTQKDGYSEHEFINGECICGNVEESEHNVTFVHNYTGSQNVIKTTENGLITYVPLREGYIFNGWWYSDGQIDSDRYILSEKFDTSKPVTQSGLTLYAEWVQERTEDSQLFSPSVSISADGVFRWNAVDNAQGYRVEIYSGSKKESDETLTVTTWTFPNNLATGYYTVKIRANGDGVHTVNSAYTQKYYAHRILTPASGIEFNISTSILSWNSVKGATSYDIIVNSQKKATVTNTTYDFSNLDAGDYTISIVAKKTGYSSSTATKSISKRRLITPTVTVNENLSSCTYTVTWSAVVNANTYRIKHHDTYISVTGTSYIINNDSPIYDSNGMGEFTVCAYDSNADYFISADSEKVTVKKLYTLKLNRSNNSAGVVSTSKQGYKVGDSVTISASTNTGYTFIGWFDNESELTSELSHTFTMPSENLTYTAKWCKVTIKSNNTSAGSVSGLNKAYKVGDNATITASAPGIGCTWLGWFDGNFKITEELSYTFAMPSENKTYTAKWEVDEQLKNFIFISTNDTLTITGVVNKTVTSIVVPNYVTSISSSAFENCSMLTSIEIPGSVTSIEDNAFSSCTNLTNIIVSENNTVYAGQDGILYNKNKTEIKSVPEGISGEITIPSSVTSIGDDAFSSCTNLASIMVDERNAMYASQDGILYNKNKTEIKYVPQAISGEITIPGSVTSIGISVFRERIGLTKVVISDGVTSIGNSAFYGCRELTNISIPNSIIRIGESAFYDCSKLIRNSGSLYYVGYWVIGYDSFYTIKALNLIGYYNQGIADGAFENCRSLQTVTLGNNIKGVGNKAFYGCYNLTSITFEGTAEMWNTVYKGNEWNDGTQAYSVKFSS